MGLKTILDTALSYVGGTPASLEEIDQEPEFWTKKRIHHQLRFGPQMICQLSTSTGIKISELQDALTQLVSEGRVRSFKPADLPDMLYARTD